MEETTRKRGRQKGTQKTGGRQKGTPNKRTAAQEALQELLMPYIAGSGLGDDKRKLAEDLNLMTPVDRAKAVASMLPYCMPKLATLEAKVEIESKSYEEELEEMSNE